MVVNQSPPRFTVSISNHFSYFYSAVSNQNSAIYVPKEDTSEDVDRDSDFEMFGSEGEEPFSNIQDSELSEFDDEDDHSRRSGEISCAAASVKGNMITRFGYFL